MRNKLIADFTEGNITNQLIGFATPLFLSNLLQIFFNMADMIIIGQKLGKVGLSAVAIGGDFYHFLCFIAMGFSSAGQVIISQYIGANHKEKIGKFIGTMFSFLITCSLLLSILCIFIKIPFLSIMNTPKDSFEQAQTYITVTMSGLVFIYGYNIISAILRGLGDSVRPFIFISIAVILNIILDLIFIIGLNMEAFGAALATVISQAVSFICGFIYILKNRYNYNIQLKKSDFIKIDIEMLIKLIKLGIPMAIKSASIQFSKLFVNSWLNSYGIVVSAFSAIANKITITTNLMSESFNTAGACMIGQNIAAEKYKRIKEIIFNILRTTFIFASVMTLSILIFPKQIYGCFTNDIEVIEIGMSFIPFAIIIFWGSAIRAAMSSFINGSGNYKINFFTAIFDGIVFRIGFAVFFALILKMEYKGFWLGDALAGYAPIIIGIIFYFSGKWKAKII